MKLANSDIAESESRCNPSDVFKKSRGRIVSMTKAIALLERVDGIKIWEDYKSKCNL